MLLAVLAHHTLDAAQLLEGTPTTPELTATVSVTPTAGITPTVEATMTPAFPPSPTPLPTPNLWMPANWLSGTGWSGGFHGVFLILTATMAIMATIVYLVLANRVYRDHTLHRWMAERVSTFLTIASVGGLILLFFGFARTPLLGWPLAFILALVALVISTAYGVYWYARVYPERLAVYERERLREKYLPKPKTAKAARSVREQAKAAARAAEKAGAKPAAPLTAPPRKSPPKKKRK